MSIAKNFRVPTNIEVTGGGSINGAANVAGVLTVGNSTVNSMINSTNGVFTNISSANVVTVGGTVTINSTGFFVGNTTANSTTVAANNVVTSFANVGTLNVIGVANAANVNVTTALTVNVVSINSTAANFANNDVTGMRVKNYKEAITTNTSITANTFAIDLSLTNVFDLKMANNITFSFSNPPATGNSYSITVWLRQDATGSRLATWPAAVKWPNAIAPTLSTGANAVDILNFMTVDGGTTYAGGMALSNVS